VVVGQVESARDTDEVHTEQRLAAAGDRTDLRMDAAVPRGDAAADYEDWVYPTVSEDGTGCRITSPITTQQSIR